MTKAAEAEVEFDLNKLAYQGARYRIDALVRQKHDMDKEIKSLKKFLRAGKQKLVAEVKQKTKRKLTAKQYKSMLKNIKKARAAKRTKQMATTGQA